MSVVNPQDHCIDPPTTIVVGKKSKSLSRKLFEVLLEFLEAYTYSVYAITRFASEDTNDFTWQQFGDVVYKKCSEPYFNQHCDESIKLAKSVLTRRRLFVYEVCLLASKGDTIVSFKVVLSNFCASEIVDDNRKRSEKAIEEMRKSLEGTIDILQKFDLPENVQTRLNTTLTQPRIRMLLQPRCCTQAACDDAVEARRSRVAAVADAVETRVARVSSFATFAL